MRILSIIVAFLLVRSVAAQKPPDETFGMLRESQGWNEGSIMLLEGTELNGLVRYNDKEGFLSYQDGENKRVFTSKSVTGFEFFDAALQQQRVFYTFAYEDSKGIKRPLFFELIREYKSFAILSRADPIEIYKGSTNYDYYGTTRVAEVSQVETIFIMDANGTLKPYIEVTTTENGLRSFFTGKDRKTKSKVVEEDLLSEYVTQPVYEQLKKYAEENDLGFKRKDDFIKILKYYDTIQK